jgi:hypothetical protein
MNADQWRQALAWYAAGVKLLEIAEFFGVAISVITNTARSAGVPKGVNEQRRAETERRAALRVREREEKRARKERAIATAIDMAKNNATIREIRQACGISQDAVQRLIAQNEIERTYGSRTQSKKQAADARRADKASRLSTARAMYESGRPVSEIAESTGFAAKTLESDFPRRYEWRRPSRPCKGCLAPVRLSSARIRFGTAWCESCRAAGVSDKERHQRREKDAEYRRKQNEAKRRYRAKNGAVTAEEHAQRWADYRAAKREARRLSNPKVQLGHYRHSGEAPSTVDGARAILKDTLIALLQQRCEDAGLYRETVEYRAKYRTNPAFRAKEKAKTAGQKKKRGVLVSPDGSLTPQVIRRLFATTSTCPYCQKLMASREKELDHMAPVSRGGQHTIGNVTVCCKSCNCRKRDKPFAVWLGQLPSHIAARFEVRCAA